MAVTLGRTGFATAGGLRTIACPVPEVLGHIVTTDGVDHFVQVGPVDQPFHGTGPAGAIQVRLAEVDGVLGYPQECRQPLS